MALTAWRADPCPLSCLVARPTASPVITRPISADLDAAARAEDWGILSEHRQFRRVKQVSASASQESVLHDVSTPAFVLDVRILIKRANELRAALCSEKVSLYYSPKALSVEPCLRALSRIVAGFSVSSLFEARLARQVSGSDGVIHYISPCLREAESESIFDICDRVTLNSMSQLVRFGGCAPEGVALGLRINPRRSFVDDERYDPCRRNSKLGVWLDHFRDSLKSNPKSFGSVSGLHLHSNCECDDLRCLVEVVRRVESCVGDDLRRFRWLNVGGGYSLEDERHFPLLRATFEHVSSALGVEIVIEPGKALVTHAGSFVATVNDIIEGDDHPIAILDLSVNHWAEVFEYGFEPRVEGHSAGAAHTYLLAGCSCLAGDLFGVYSFDAPLEIGSRVILRDAGAYSMVKAHMFNGINLPAIHVIRENGAVELVREFTYEDFLTRCGGDPNAVTGT